MENIGWGTIPDWIAAIGTVGSLFLALWLLKNEINQRKDREIEEQSKSARHISVWSEVMGEMSPEEFTLSAKNTGDDPVYDCVLFSDLPILLWAATTGEDRFNEETTGKVEHMFGILAPGETRHCKFDSKGVLYEYQGIPDVWVEFTDASGKHWLRDRHGKLRLIFERTPWD